MPSPVAPSRIALTDLAFGVGGHEILRGMTLSVDVTRLGIIGRNGSGKSTLVRVLAGLVAPSGGQVRINGHVLARDRRAALAEVGILFQNPDHQIIFPTVIEELAFGLTQQGNTRAQARDGALGVLQRFGVSHWAETAIATLSQGQKHLVCLMAVVAMKPRLLLLDEPFAGLDLPTKTQLARYLALYEGALVHVTHDADDLAGYPDCLWIDEGRIRAHGPTPEVLLAYRAAMQRIGEADDLAHLAG